jgi:cyclophilin family peptidyl-prolyl cis-trans isomerase
MDDPHAAGVRLRTPHADRYNAQSCFASARLEGDPLVMSLNRTLPAFALLLALSGCASLMGQQASPDATPAPAAEGGAASLSDMEAAAGHVLILGPRLTFETPKGSFTIVTFPKEAPQTTEQIVKLAESGFYDGIAFHRVVSDFVVQAGDPASKTGALDDPKLGRGGSGHPLPPEFQGQKIYHLTGTVALARGKEPNSGDSQFYVTLKPIPHLNGGYTVFGQVIRGMDVVKKIERGDKITKVTVMRPGAAKAASPDPRHQPGPGNGR